MRLVLIVNLISGTLVSRFYIIYKMRFNILFPTVSFLLLSFYTSGQLKQIKLKPYTFSAQNNIEFLDGFIFSDVSSNLIFNRGQLEVFIYKFDLQLNILDSLKLEISDSTIQVNSFRITQLKSLDSALVAMVSYSLKGSRNCPKVNSALIFFNSSLQITREIHFEADSNFLDFVYYDMNSQGIALAGYLYDCDSMNYNVCVGYYNLNDSSYKLRIYPDSLNNNAALTAQSPILLNKGILFDIWPSKAPEFKNNIFVDYDLNLISEGSVLQANRPDLITLHRSAFFIKSKNGVVQLGLSRSYQDSNLLPGAGPGYWNLAFSLLDSNYNVSVIDTLPLSGYNFRTSKDILAEPFMWIDAADYANTDSTLIVQGVKTIVDFNFDSQDTTPFYIYNLNLNTKSVNWVRKITRPYTNGNHSIAALPGNRCAIAFNEYNWDDYSGENLAVHIWILDANGSVISQREFKAPANPISLFPNPCSDYLRVSFAKQQKWPLAYSVFNTKGDRVAKGQIRQEQNTVDTRQLSPGQYYLSLEGMGSAKFLKK